MLLLYVWFPSFVCKVEGITHRDLSCWDTRTVTRSVICIVILFLLGIFRIFGRIPSLLYRVIPGVVTTHSCPDTLCLFLLPNKTNLFFEFLRRATSVVNLIRNLY